jgi:hypothetical protein
MLLYVLICISLSLVGVAGLQLMYMFYLERIDAERRKTVTELERKCKNLTSRLQEAECQLAEQRKMLESAYAEADDDEVWADVIDER